MLKVSSLKALVKLVEPIGNDHIVYFENNRLVVRSIDASNTIIGVFSMPVVLNGEAKTGLGVNMTTLKNILPKDIDAVGINFGQVWEITATDYKARMPTVNAVSCCKSPTKPPAPGPNPLSVSPQKFFDQITQLKAVLKASFCFRMAVDPKDPGKIRLTDEDATEGSLMLTLPTISEIKSMEDQFFPYDTGTSTLNSIRLFCDTVEVSYVNLPANDVLKALIIKGVTNDRDCPIDVQYVLAPRVRE